MSRRASPGHQIDAITDTLALPIGEVCLGDCLEVLSDFPKESIDLAFLDPPFNTGKHQSTHAASYEDTWSGIQEYLQYMRPRVEIICHTLKPTGVILLHCDWRTCHHFRLLLDAVLGEANFVNHLIWSYGLGGSSPRRFARKHDDILFYAKGETYFFDPPLVPATSNRMKGQMKKATDVIEIPSINNMAAERVGYPTQKPLALLDMLVRACCPEHGIVLDAFCGSGTTLVAAAQSGRRFIGIDTHQEAVRIARTRCEKAADEINN